MSPFFCNEQKKKQHNKYSNLTHFENSIKSTSFISCFKYFELIAIIYKIDVSFIKLKKKKENSSKSENQLTS